MTSELIVIKEKEGNFQSLFSASVELENAPELLKKMRKKAWEQFLEIGLPGPRHESFEYMRLKPLFATEFVKAKNQGKNISKETIATAVLEECRQSHLVFINGYFHPELSDTSALDPSIVIAPLEKAMKTYGTLIQNRFTKALKDEKDIFCALNAACHTDGLFVYVPPKLVVSTPLQIIHMIEEENSWMMPRMHVFQGAFSELTLVQTVSWQTQGKYLYNQTTEFVIEEQATTKFIQNALSSSSEKTAGYIFDDLRVEMKRHSNFHAYQLTDGYATLRRDSKVQLAGEGGDVHLNGVWLLDDEKEAHINIVIEHQEPHTQSLQLYKGVLTDTAKSSFQGKILVRKKAQKTQAYQLNNNLLLSDQAQANSKPNLEIFADDVKASHGATMGQLDPEEMFYLKTRGFSEKDARRILIAGFCQEVVDKIPVPSLRKAASLRIQKFVSQ